MQKSFPFDSKTRQENKQMLPGKTGVKQQLADSEKSQVEPRIILKTLLLLSSLCLIKLNYQNITKK